MYNSHPDESIDYESDVTVHTDGRTYTVPAGTQIRLTPGESIYIQQYLYHDFEVEPGTGDVLLGEVSQCNDDAKDNRFNRPWAASRPSRRTKRLTVCSAPSTPRPRTEWVRTMIDVVALGELLIDFAASPRTAPDTPPWPPTPARPRQFSGRADAYGRKTAFLGKVGNDAFGNLLLGTLNAAGIETKGILVDDSVFTTLAFVTFDESGDRSFSFARKPARIPSCGGRKWTSPH